MNEPLVLAITQQANIPRATCKRMKRLLTYKPHRLLAGALQYDKQLRRIHTSRALERIALSKKQPISLLTECWGKACPNNRFRYPEKRRAAAQKAIELIHHYRAQQNNYLELIFWGSGSLLQELIILHQLASQQTPLTLNIVLIDSLYEDYCQLIRVQNTNVIILNQPYPTTCTSQLQKAILTQIHARFYQIARWTMQAYPQHTISWFCDYRYSNKITQTSTILIALDAPHEEALCFKPPFIALTEKELLRTDY